MQGIHVCRQAANEERRARDYRGSDDLPLAIAADAAATRFRAMHMRTVRGYQGAAETYAEAAHRAATRFAESRARQQQADMLSGESLRRAVTSRTASALQALREKRRLQQHLAQACAYAASLQERHDSCAARAAQASVAAHGSAPEQRSRAEHLLAQTQTASSHAEQIRNQAVACNAHLITSIQAVQQEEQLRRDSEAAAVRTAITSVSKTLAAAKGRAERACVDAQALRADAAKLEQGAAEVTASSKSAELMRARVQGLLQEASLQDAAADAAAAESDSLSKQQQTLRTQQDELQRMFAQLPLLPNELQIELDEASNCFEDATGTVELQPTSHEDLAAAVQASVNACEAAVNAMNEHLKGAEAQRAACGQQVMTADNELADAQAQHAGAEERVNSAQHAEEAAVAAADAAVAQVKVNVAQKALSTLQGFLLEVDSRVADVRQSRTACEQISKLMCDKHTQMKEACARAAAAKAPRQRIKDSVGAISDLKIELQHFEGELNDLLATQEQTTASAFDAIDKGDGRRSDELMAEVRALALRRQEVQESKAELQADLQKLEGHAAAHQVCACFSGALLLGFC